MLLGYGTYGLTKRYIATHNAHPLPSSNAVITSQSNSPDETPISLKSGYTVPANQPREISLPSIGAAGFIEKVATTKQGAMATPSDVNLAGWYVNSSLPGAPGLGIINGHVQGYYEPGIFKKLADLKSGDIFRVQLGDLTWRSFQVVSVNTYSVSAVAGRLFAKEPGISAQLNLITCGGVYSRTQRVYLSRVLVVSKLIG